MIIVDKKTGDSVRTKALRVCDDPEAARAAWLRVSRDGRCHGKVSRAARFVMLQVLADGGSVPDAEKAARAVLE